MTGSRVRAWAGLEDLGGLLDDDDGGVELPDEVPVQRRPRRCQPHHVTARGGGGFGGFGRGRGALEGTGRGDANVEMRGGGILRGVDWGEGCKHLEMNGTCLPLGLAT